MAEFYDKTPVKNDMYAFITNYTAEIRKFIMTIITRYLDVCDKGAVSKLKKLIKIIDKKGIEVNVINDCLNDRKDNHIYDKECAILFDQAFNFTMTDKTNLTSEGFKSLIYELKEIRNSCVHPWNDKNVKAKDFEDFDQDVMNKNGKTIVKMASLTDMYLMSNNGYSDLANDRYVNKDSDIYFFTHPNKRIFIINMQLTVDEKAKPIKVKELNKLKESAEEGDSEAQLKLFWYYIDQISQHLEDKDDDELTRYLNKAKTWIFASAYNNNSMAEFYLGDIYEGGKLFVEESEKESLKWFRRSALHGNVDSQVRLGRYYYELQGNDYKKGFKWYKMAADQNKDSYSEYMVGHSYELGQGVDKSVPEALKYYEMADKQMQPLASYRLGIIYSEGKIVDKNLEKAKTFFISASKQSKTWIKYNVGRIFEDGEMIPRSNQIARRCYEEIVNSEEYSDELSWAHFRLGKMYEEGLGLAKPNKKKALYHYEQALNDKRPDNVSPDIDTCYRLGKIYDRGEFGEKSIEKAIKYYKMVPSRDNPRDLILLESFRRYHPEMYLQDETGLNWLQNWLQNRNIQRKDTEIAAEEGDPIAQCSIANRIVKRIEHQHLPESELEKAYDWYKKSIKQNCSWAKLCFGMLLIEKEYEDEEGFEYVRSAVDEGCTFGLYLLAELYEEGIGTKKNAEMALKCYREYADIYHHAYRECDDNGPWDCFNLP